MKNILVSLVLVFAYTICTAQLIPNMNSKEKWGYVDSVGNVVINHKYNSAASFYDGRAIVQKGNKYGVINENGEDILKTSYTAIQDYYGKCYKVATGGKMENDYLTGAKWGFMSYDGEAILLPEYNEIGEFINGIAYVKKGAKYGFIAEDLSVLIPCNFTAVGLFNDAGLVWVNQGGRMVGGELEPRPKVEGGKFGVYNNKGEVIIPVMYAGICPFELLEEKYTDEQLKSENARNRRIKRDQGTHRLLVSKVYERKLFDKLQPSLNSDYAVYTNMKKPNGIISSDGTVRVPVGQYKYFVHGIEEGVAPVYNEKRGYNFLQISTGLLLGPVWYERAYSFQNGIAVCQKSSDDYFFVDTTNTEVSPHYKYLSPLNEGVYIKQNKTDEKWGLLDERGKVVADDNFSVIFPETEGGLFGATCADTGLSGFINNKGVFVVQPIYGATTTYMHGFSMVKKDSHWGVVNLRGEEVISCEWDDIAIPSDTTDNRLWAQKSDLWYCLDLKSGTLAFEKGYKTVTGFSKFIPTVSLILENEKVGVIDVNGKVVLPAIFEDNISQVTTAYELFKSSGRSEWTEFDTYLYKLRHNPDRNTYKLTQTIDANMWDY